MLKEFREFISRGNVLDLAVGVIIGAAFGKIVTTLVENVIMPPIGLVLGQHRLLEPLLRPRLDQRASPSHSPTPRPRASR